MTFPAAEIDSSTPEIVLIFSWGPKICVVDLVHVIYFRFGSIKYFGQKEREHFWRLQKLLCRTDRELSSCQFMLWHGKAQVNYQSNIYHDIEEASKGNGDLRCSPEYSVWICIWPSDFFEYLTGERY